MSETQTDPKPDDEQALPTGTWLEVSSASEVTFKTRTLFGLLSVNGTFTGHSGEMTVDDEGRASGQLELDAASVETGIRKRDDHLASADYFDAENNPKIVVRFSSIDPAPAGGTVQGELQIRDNTIPIQGPLEFEQLGPDRIRLTAEIPFDHHSAGLGWRKTGQIRGVIPVRASIVLDRQPAA
jgi:polyisoprenoid-binding protein YceI